MVNRSVDFADVEPVELEGQLQGQMALNMESRDMNLSSSFAMT